MTAALFARGGTRATSALPYVSALPSAFVARPWAHQRGSGELEESNW
jgi:hypothetical protein